MRTTFSLLLVASFAIGVRLADKSGRTAGRDNRAKGFVVLELFTSEGCSSCPPADKVFARLQDDFGNEPVYLLAYHVDYWDRLGWKDAFSNHDYSTRQYKYGSWLNLQSVYTPQVVINGSKELVGSNESELRSTIKTALRNDAVVNLSLTSVSIKDGKIEIGYRLSKKMENSSIAITLVERSATTMVLKGENQGKELHHVQIVRDQKIVPAAQVDAVSIAMPSGVESKELQVIAFLQDDATGHILTAARSDIK